MEIKEHRLEITDTTLIELWGNYRQSVEDNPHKIKELIKLIYICGCDYIEITEELYKLLSPLPSDVRFKVRKSANIRVDKIDDIGKLYDIFKNYNLEEIRISGLGDLILYNYESILKKIIDVFKDKVELSLNNKYNSATALALEYIELGGKKIAVSFCGVGGNVPLEEILAALRYIENINLKGDLKVLPKIAQLFEEITRQETPCNKPVIGRKIFDVESGIHVDGIEKDSRTFEPYNPEEIGRNRNIIIGKFSGINSIKIKLNKLKIQYKSEYLKDILREVKKESSSKLRGLNDEEIKRICIKLGGRIV